MNVDPEEGKRGLIIGQAPRLGAADDLPPLSGLPERRLASLAGLTVEELWGKFDRVNLLTAFPGRVCDVGSEDSGEVAVGYVENEGEFNMERKVEAAAQLRVRPKGDQFPLTEGRDAATRLLPHLRKYSHVVMLGLNVAKAFCAPKVDLLDTFVLCDEAEVGGNVPWAEGPSRPPSTPTLVLVLPHPSGVSHFWYHTATLTSLLTLALTLASHHTHTQEHGKPD
jgi:hypothetical protein